MHGPTCIFWANLAPFLRQAIAYDCCSEDAPGTDPETGEKSNAGSCNLHPQARRAPGPLCAGIASRFLCKHGAA
jgi:hypothetical protein